MDGKELASVVEQLKTLEHEGFHFEAADGSLELLMRGATGWAQPFFELESFRVTVEHRAPSSGATGVQGAEVITEATVKVKIGDERVIETAEGNGPVNALDQAFRKAFGQAHPGLSSFHLTDY